MGNDPLQIPTVPVSIHGSFSSRYFRNYTPEGWLTLQIDSVFTPEPPKRRLQPASVFDLGEVTDLSYRGFKYYLSLRVGRWHRGNIFKP